MSALVELCFLFVLLVKNLHFPKFHGRQCKWGDLGQFQPEECSLVLCFSE